MIQKRKANITTEPLDLCFQRGLINEQQHNAGIRLRWLYTLKFGAPTISSYSPDNVGGHSCKYEDNGWMWHRQLEYKLMIERLEKSKARKIVVDICIFSRMPQFLYKIPDNLKMTNLVTLKDLKLFQDGLDEISSQDFTKKAC